MQIIRDFVRARIAVVDCGYLTECWIWTRCRRDGYGRADLGGRTHQAHRISYEAFKGEIPDGLEIDHLCCVTNCVNPAHLEPVTRQENLRRKAVRRGYVVGGKVRRIAGGRKHRAPRRLPTHCKRGHEYTPENTKLVAKVGEKPFRVCRTCLRENAAARRQRNPGRDRPYREAWRARQKALAARAKLVGGAEQAARATGKPTQQVTFRTHDEGGL